MNEEGQSPRSLQCTPDLYNQCSCCSLLYLLEKHSQTKMGLIWMFAIEWTKRLGK